MKEAAALLPLHFVELLFRSSFSVSEQETDQETGVDMLRPGPMPGRALIFCF